MNKIKAMRPIPAPIYVTNFFLTQLEVIKITAASISAIAAAIEVSIYEL